MSKINYIKKHYPPGTIIRSLSNPNQFPRIRTTRLNYCSRDLNSIWADGGKIIYDAKIDKYAEIVGFEKVKLNI